MILGVVNPLGEFQEMGHVSLEAWNTNLTADIDGGLN
jgi:hypothetical protein